MPEKSASVIRHLRPRVTVLAVAGAVLALAAPSAATALTGPSRGVSAGPVSVMKYTAKERRDALAYWTPARIKAVGKSVELGPTGPKAKPWKGTSMKAVVNVHRARRNQTD
ncbi:hypothetical protein [Streptomyces sp. NPDC051132]|uniref:hypothetical protein n=1 Tax=unclassified Streptomyces TaxID=2593676 RepID=UPI00342F0F13